VVLFHDKIDEHWTPLQLTALVYPSETHWSFSNLDVEC